MITWNSHYNIMNKIFMCLICILLISTPFISQSADPTTPDASSTATQGITAVFCRVTKILTGDFARVLSMIIAIFVGSMLLFGKLQWMIAITIIIGLGLLFSAEKIGTFLGDGGTVNVCDAIKDK